MSYQPDAIRQSTIANLHAAYLIGEQEVQRTTLTHGNTLRAGSLNPDQPEIVRALREGLGLLEERTVGDVKVPVDLNAAMTIAR